MVWKAIHLKEVKYLFAKSKQEAEAKLKRKYPNVIYNIEPFNSTSKNGCSNKQWSLI